VLNVQQFQLLSEQSCPIVSSLRRGLESYKSNQLDSKSAIGHFSHRSTTMYTPINLIICHQHHDARVKGAGEGQEELIIT
jgi:hypothetical protein